MKKLPSFFEKSMEENRNAFVYGPGLGRYIENEQIIVMKEKTFDKRGGKPHNFWIKRQASDF